MKVTTPLTLAFAMSATSVLAGDITLRISGVRPDQGGVIHALAFNDKTAFDQNMFAKMVGYVKIPADAETVSGVLKGQSEGALAIMLHHDANDNGQFEMKGAIPLEGWAYSRGAGAEAVPVFEDAAIDYGGSDETMDLQMLYAD